MASKFVLGRGTVLSISTDGGTTYIPVNQLKTIQFSGGKSDLEDITNMGSPGAFREYAPTLLDAGQAALQGIFDPEDAGQLALSAAWIAQALLTVKMQFPKASDQTTVGLMRTFTAYVSEDNLDAQFDKTSTLAVTLKITGPITDTQGS